MLDEFPADGKMFYGTQRSRPAWDAEFAELWEMRDGPDGVLTPVVAHRELGRHADDAGAGQRERRRHGRAGRRRRGHVRRRLRRQGRAGEDRAGLGAAGARRRRGRRPVRRRRHRQLRAEPAHRLVGRGRQPHALGPPRDASAGRGRSRSWCRSSRRAPCSSGCAAANGSACTPSCGPASIRAPTTIATASIPGAIPPAATRRSSSAATSTIRGRAPTTTPAAARRSSRWRGRCRSSSPKGGCRRRRARIRFVWPPEIEGTLALLNARPEWTARVKAAIHLDMVGGGPETKAVFPRHARAGQPAVVRLRRGGGGRRVRQRRDDALRGDRRGGVSADGGRRAEASRCAPSSSSSRAAAITRSTATARSASRPSTSTTGPTATSTPTPTPPPTSTPPSCGAPRSSPPPRAGCSRISTRQRCRPCGRRCGRRSCSALPCSSSVEAC